MSSDETYGSPSGQHNSTIEYAENAKIAGVAGKKVWNLDSTGNLVNPATSSNQTDGSQKTQIVETLPDDSTKLNPAISCTRNANGYVTILTMTANGVTKTKTITRDVNDYWTNIGEWV